MKKTFFILLTLLLCSHLFSQTYTMSNGANGKVTSCSGVFVDNGGSSSNYALNQNSTITFCPVTPGDKIKISFNSFETEDLDNNGDNTDYLDVWYGSTIGTSSTQNERFFGKLGAFTITSTSSDGCISLKFISDGVVNYPGWSANISCVTPCTVPIAGLINNTAVDICPPSSTNPGSLSVPFDASPSTAGSGNIVTYEWDWGDGTKSVTTTAKTSHIFPNQGIFITRLKVRNDNTNVDPLGCQSTNAVTKTIRVMPSPIFTGSSASTVNIACGDSTTLVAAITSQTISQQTPSVVSGTVSLPDGSGDSFTLGIDYAGFFPVGATVASGCYPTLKFNLEHSYAGDLSIDLISPSGQTVRVFTNDGIDNDNKFGTCANTNDDGIPGCGANYTVVNSGGINWPKAGASGTTSVTKTCSSYTGNCGSGSYYKPQTYNSANPFSAFNGAELNGVWTIKIIDNLKDDDGTLFSWSLDFPQTCYVSLATVTPNITTATWSHSGSGPVIPTQTTASSVITNPGPGACPSPGPCLGNKLTNSVSVGPFPTAGTFVYKATAVDQFGCQYENPVTVNVTCSSCPTATIKYAPNSFCISDATTQTVIVTGTGTTLLGTYRSAPSGLKIDPTTGTITPNMSTAGTYTVNYDVVASGSCPAYTVSTTVIINTIPAPPQYTITQPSCAAATATTIAITGVTGETYSFDSGAYSSTLTYSGLVSGSSHTVLAKNTFGCISTPTTIVLSAQPVAPIVTATPQLKAICSGSSPAIALSSTEVGTTYVWNAIQTNVNGAVAGSGDAISQALTTVGNKLGEAVYAVTPTANGCRGTTLLVVVTVNPIPEVSANPTQETICSGNATNITLTSNVVGTAFNWTAIQTDVLGALSGSGNTIAQSLRTAGKIQGKADYTVTPTINGCTGIPIMVTVMVDPSPEVFASSGTIICSGESSNITLSPNIPGTIFTWTASQTGVMGATAGTGDAIDQILEADTNVGKAIYTITPSLKDCVGKSIMITVNVNPAPSPAIVGGIICVEQVTNSTIKSYILTTGLNNAKYDFEWFLDGVLIDGAVASSYEATKVGNYSVIVTNTLTGCVSKEVPATVVANFPAENPFLTTVTDAFTQNGIITVLVKGGTGPFLYQLDMGAFQSDNVFTGASGGLHTVTVMDPQGCTDMSQKVTVIDYPRYFTPNGDGINDTWNIGALNDQPNAIIYIYDSYGKLIKQIGTGGQGWDGTYNGKPLPSSDYWFTINYLETNTNKLFKAHFSLKR